MATSPVTPEQLNCALSPARARAALAAVNAKPFGGNLENHLTAEEVAAARELFQADPNGNITLRAIVHRIGEAEGETFEMPRALVVWKALAEHHRTVIKANAGGASCGLAEWLAYLDADLDDYADLAGIHFPTDAPRWRINVAADSSTYGDLYRRGATLAEALASITAEDIDAVATQRSDGNFGHRIRSAVRLDVNGADTDEDHDVDRPVGGYEVWEKPVGLIAAWRTIAERMAAAEPGEDFAALAAQARALLSPFPPGSRIA